MTQQIKLSDLPKPEEIPGLFAKHQLGPVRGKFGGAFVVGGVVIHPRCGCLVTILAQHFGVKHDEEVGYSPGFEQVGINEVKFWALADGWDDYDDNNLGCKNPDAQPWYDYAQDCARIVFPNAPPRPKEEYDAEQAV